MQAEEEEDEEPQEQQEADEEESEADAEEIHYTTAWGVGRGVGLLMMKNASA